MAQSSCFDVAPRHQDIHQDDFGRWRIGLGDDQLGPFESRAFAMSVAGCLLPEPAMPLRRRSFFNIKTAKEARRVARLSAGP
jgi:hypothetical protein